MKQNGCNHANIGLRRKTTTNGTAMWGHQCTRCGRMQGDWLKSTAPAVVNGGPLPAWDDQLAEQYFAETRARERQVHKDGRWQDGAEVREAEQRKWWRDYNEYLKSPAWRAKRALVLRRAGGYCEGCLTEEATQVHHLTYRHVRAELCFELVALCQFCHDRIHDEHLEADLSQLRYIKPRVAIGS